MQIHLPKEKVEQDYSKDYDGHRKQLVCLIQNETQSYETPSVETTILFSTKYQRKQFADCVKSKRVRLEYSKFLIGVYEKENQRKASSIPQCFGSANRVASRAMRTYTPYSACRKYAARGSESKLGLISPTRGSGCITIIPVDLANVISSGVMTNWFSESSRESVAWIRSA